MPAKDAAAIRDNGDGQVKLVSFQSPWSFGLAFNNSKEPFNDKRVRQALSYAVPYERDHRRRDVRARAAGEEHGAAGMATHDPSAWKYDTDLQKAKEMLERRGPPRRVQEQHRRPDRAS